MLGIYTSILLSLAMAIRAQLEGHIVGGTMAKINRYPHSAFLGVGCVNEKVSLGQWMCGSSLLNQQILLTAGHCVYSCRSGTRISVNMGNPNRYKGIIRSASNFVIHEKYDYISNSCDIAMVKLSRPVKFSSVIRRVAIMQIPPYQEPADLAGWGDTDELTKKQGIHLLEIDQKVWRHNSCERLFYDMPRGTICASSKHRKSFAASGDSGSALTVRGFIQIGLVSYKVPSIAANVIVYTDVGYHYEWIKFNARRLQCSVRS